MSTSIDRSYRSFSEFYPDYLRQHRNRSNRRLHFVAMMSVLLLILSFVLTRNMWWLAAIPVVAYGFAWSGHFFFERNKPATFGRPIYSLLGELAMFKDILTGKIRF